MTCPLRSFAAFLFLIAVTPFAQGEEKESAPSAPFDVVIKGGMLYDGTGGKPRVTDVAIRGDRIAGLGNFPADRARTVIDAKGMAVAPGFINMLSWSTESLIEDGRSQSEIRQGVTTEIMGEGWSMGPLNDRMKERVISEQKRHQIRDQMEHAGRISDISGATRNRTERGLVPRSDNGPRVRHRARRQGADAGAVGRNAPARPARKWKQARSASALR